MSVENAPVTIDVAQTKLFLVAQMAAIIILIIVTLILALRDPEELVAARTQALLHSQEQQNRTALAQLELVWTKGEQERRTLLDTFNQRIDKLEADNRALRELQTLAGENQSQNLTNLSKNIASTEQSLMKGYAAVDKAIANSNQAQEQHIVVIQANIKQLEKVVDAHNIAQSKGLAQLTQDLVDLDRRLEAREVALIRGSRLLERMQETSITQPSVINSPKAVPPSPAVASPKK